MVRATGGKEGDSWETVSTTPRCMALLCTQSAPVRHAGVRQEAGGGEAAPQAAAVGAEPPDEAEHLVAVHLQHAHRSPHLHARV